MHFVYFFHVPALIFTQSTTLYRPLCLIGNPYMPPACARVCPEIMSGRPSGYHVGAAGSGYHVGPAVPGYGATVIFQPGPS
ncbi:hypothetical protein DWX59_03340 [Enterocloster aldenensis]|nr:hypothetical protein [Clostridiales bacterium AHG0011]RGC30516.1 hypothetical protein DWX59_03340 [Enterocloster aldenensis]RGC64468.1 hypothetical protein DW690_01890 [Dorea longicatena]